MEVFWRCIAFSAEKRLSRQACKDLAVFLTKPEPNTKQNGFFDQNENNQTAMGAEVWKTDRLGNFITLKRGYDLPKQDRKEGYVPIYSSAGLSGYHNEAKIKGPGVITGRYGTLGEVFYSENDYWPHNTALYVKDFKGNDPKFIFYFLQTLGFERNNDKTSVPGVNRNDLHEMQVRIPDLPTQKRIASILSAFDDKIENNRQTARTLEAMAQALFQEWFVDSRFPGATGEMEETELGWVPKGWRVGTLGELATSVSESVDPASINPDTPYVGLEHIQRKNLSIAAWGSAADVGSQKRRFRNGDILFGKLRPYFHKVGLPAKSGICSTDILVIRPKVERYYCYVTNIVFQDAFVEYASRIADGTRMPRTEWKQLAKYEIAIPNSDTLERFDSSVLPYYQMLIDLEKECASLKEARTDVLSSLFH